MTDYSKMTTEELEQLSSQLHHEEYIIMKELIKRSSAVEHTVESNSVQPADMKPTEEDF